MADDYSQLAGIDRRRLLQGLGGAGAIALAGCLGGGGGGDGGTGGGSLSLAQVKSPVEMDLMRQIKAVLDPGNLMNPGKVV